MKLILILFMCIVFNISKYNAETIYTEKLPYYVKITQNNNSKIVNVSKIYDSSNNVLFNISYDNKILDNYDKFIYDSKCNYNISKFNMFLTISSLGYNENKSDYNYYLTQLYIWKFISNYNITPVDQFGNYLSNVQKDFNKLHTKINYHNMESVLFHTEKNTEIWTENIYKYDPYALILDFKEVNGLNIKMNNDKIHIYNNKVGKYEINFYKDYENEAYCYKNANSVLWQNLKGPADVNKTLKYNVFGTRLNIKENLIGINKRFGDAISNSKYEIYLDDILKLSVSNKDEIYLKSNNKYLIKDISNDNYNNSDNVILELDDQEYTVVIDKHVISKNISIDINDKDNYYVYLKSNNELYEKINKNTNLITLPFGTYYIKNESNTYYNEFNVFDSVDEELKIELESESIQNEYIPNYVDLVIDNPNTGDNIFYKVKNCMFSVVLLYSVLLLKRRFI